jgi:hypothetical protein
MKATKQHNSDKTERHANELDDGFTIEENDMTKKQTIATGSAIASKGPRPDNRSFKTRRLEVISCVANCLGKNASIQYLFDVINVRTGEVYQNLAAHKIGNKWSILAANGQHDYQGVLLPKSIERDLSQGPPISFTEAELRTIYFWLDECAKNLYVRAADEAAAEEDLEQFAKIRKSTLYHDYHDEKNIFCSRNFPIAYNKWSANNSLTK